MKALTRISIAQVITHFDYDTPDLNTSRKQALPSLDKLCSARSQVDLESEEHEQVKPSRTRPSSVTTRILILDGSFGDRC